MEHNEIIDFHMHPYCTPEQNMCGYGGVYEWDLQEVKARLNKAGITHICGSVLEKECVDADFIYLKKLNRDALILREQFGGFYTPGFHIHPGYVKESCAEIEFMHENGVNLIGELVPYLHGWDSYEGKGLMEILDKARQYRMAVSYHSTGAFQMDRAIEAFPELTFVAAHPGEKPNVEMHVRRMKRFPNLYLDLSGTGLHRFGLVKYLAEEAGAHRILFGTDYPICNPGMYVQAVCCEEISGEDRRKIFFENARRILDLK